LLTSRKARISNEPTDAAAVISQPDQRCSNPGEDSSGRPGGSHSHPATGLISLVKASAELVAAAAAVAVAVGRGARRGVEELPLCRILVVDDEPDLRFILRRIFERAGHEVADAGHGADALACLRESRPDLVVTDMMMPVMGGHELIRRLRADPATARIPILAVTGNGELADAADALLAKPYQPDQIMAAANALLGQTGDSA
jgi:CheY-like chemotaxis protein